jgi:thiol:disulfide interchange protein DsbC
MKRMIGLIVMIGLMLSTSSAKEVFLKQNILNKIQNIDIVKKGGFKVIKGKTVGALYAIKATNPRSPDLTLFVTKDLKTIVIGAGFNEKGQRIEFLTNMKQYKDKAIWTVGNGSKNYYVFTDPECPYCQTFEKNLNNLKLDAKLHFFLFPLSFHKDAKSMSKYIISQKSSAEKAKAMEKIAKGNKAFQKAKYSDAENTKLEEIIKENINLSRKLGVNGTPMIFDEEGRKINWPTLLTKPPVR